MSSNTNSPFISNENRDQFDQKMASIMQSSISLMFRQLIEPVDSNSGKHDIDTAIKQSSPSPSPPPLKLHDFGGSDFVRLAEKSRRNRNGRSQEAIMMDPPKTMTHTSSKPNTQSASLLNKDWKMTQDCVYRTDGSEETVYEKRKDGTATETLHHVVYPDGTVKNIKTFAATTATIPSSPSIASSLSSMDSPPVNGPIRRLWNLVFD